MCRSGPSRVPLSRLSPFSPHVCSLSLPLSLRLSHSACSGNHSPLSFVYPSPVSLAPTARVSIMTPRGGTIPEVKSERRNHDVHSMESLSSTDAGRSKKLAIRARSFARAEKIRFFRPAFALGIRAYASHARTAPEEKSRSCRYLVLRGRSLKVRRFVES